MSKLVLIFPYFGRFPNYFNLFLRTASYNKSVDYCILTDNKKVIKKYSKISSNIYFHLTLFSDVQKRIRDLFDQEVAIDRPYKLCDYKQFYNLIFEQYISGYEYWGFGDVDVLHGDFSSFKPFNENHDIYFRAGHLQFFKNVPQVNDILSLTPP